MLKTVSDLFCNIICDPNYFYAHKFLIANLNLAMLICVISCYLLHKCLSLFGHSCIVLGSDVE